MTLPNKKDNEKITKQEANLSVLFEPVTSLHRLLAALPNLASVLPQLCLCLPQLWRRCSCGGKHGMRQPGPSWLRWPPLDWCHAGTSEPGPVGAGSMALMKKKTWKKRRRHMHRPCQVDHMCWDTQSLDNTLQLLSHSDFLSESARCQLARYHEWRQQDMQPEG